MKFRWKALILFILLIIEALFLKGCPNGVVKHPSGPVVLPPGTTEQVVVDPVRHELIITTKKGTTKQTLPDRKSTFDVQANGTVKVSAAQFGYEVRPYLGIGANEGIRAYLGADLLYFKRCDLGLGVGLPPLGKSNRQVGDIRPLVNVGYVVWDNLSMNLGIDSSKQMHVFLTVRI